jgi:DNA-binding PadR family transcriptional regulator
MIQKLIILGFLKEMPCSGYDIKKFLEKKLGIFSQLDTSSIYYPLKKMEKEGLIKKRELKGKKHLKKYLYTITPKGEKEFINLSQQTLVSKKRPFIDIDIPLYFLPYLRKKEVILRLRLRKRFLNKAKKWLISKLGHKTDFLPHQILILKHHLNLLRAEEKFVNEFIEFVKGYPIE